MLSIYFLYFASQAISFKSAMFCSVLVHLQQRMCARIKIGSLSFFPSQFLVIRKQDQTI